MTDLRTELLIEQLEARKGGYSYLRIEASVVSQFDKKRETRLICALDNTISFRCELNHLGDGNYFIIVAARYLKALKKKAGSTIISELTKTRIH